MPSPLNPTKKKHRSNKAWLQEHVNDPYVKEAQRRGIPKPMGLEFDTAYLNGHGHR